jgi:glutathione synthase
MSGPKYKILVLTDHHIHGPVDSLYALLRTMALHPACEFIHVASRGVPENAPFFEAPERETAWMVPASPVFQWTTMGMAFERPFQQGKMEDYDMVFLRMPRSSSEPLFEHLSKVVAPNRIMNRPDSILETGSKAYLVNFPELCPPIRMVHSLLEVEAFLNEHPLVLKPLEGSGGKGIVKIKDGRADLEGEQFTWPEFRTQLQPMLKSGMLAMQYLKNVSLGDKRTIVANGEIIGSSLRKPPAGDWRANVSLGGSSEYAEPDADELEIARVLAEDLLPKGIALFGFDTLVDDDGRRRLSEINSSCVNGIYPAEMHSGKPYIRRTADLLWDYIIGQLSN